MIADLKPYPEYKESGLAWIGQVPVHWDVRRMKSTVMNVIEQTSEMNRNEVYVALEHVEGWTGKPGPSQDRRSSQDKSSVSSKATCCLESCDRTWPRLPALAKTACARESSLCYALLVKR